MCACRNSPRVSLCDATHWRRASALHTRFDAPAVSDAGDSSGYTDTISCRRADITPVGGVGRRQCVHVGVGVER